MTEAEQDETTPEPGEMTAMNESSNMEEWMGMEEVPRHIVKLFQCPDCSNILDTPTTLPCGTSVCRRCIPETFARSVSYPAELASQPGFICNMCGEEHSTGKVDVTLSTIVQTVKAYLSSCHPFDDRAGVYLRRDSDAEESRVVLPGGRLAATFALMENNGLPYDSDLTYSPLSATEDEIRAADITVLKGLKDCLKSEVECVICCNILFDPVTTSCGHTFCRQCLERVLDVSKLCPNCRNELYLPSILPRNSTNKFLSEILISLFGSELQERAQQRKVEELAGDTFENLDIPIFVCTASLPHTPTYLNIFEPRYRLMLRRVLEGNRRFGMVMNNRSRIDQGEFGTVGFMQYGTMLEITDARWTEDGQAAIGCRGLYKFRIRRHGIKDGYVVADVERHDDLPISEEQHLESLDVRLAAEMSSFPRNPSLNMMSTQALLQQCYQMAMALLNSSPESRSYTESVFGPPPNDARSLPYWVGAVLPLQEPEKYKLVLENSVRQRLKIALDWLIIINMRLPLNRG